MGGWVGTPLTLPPLDPRMGVKRQAGKLAKIFLDKSVGSDRSFSRALVLSAHFGRRAVLDIGVLRKLRLL